MLEDRTIEVLVENIDWKTAGYDVESYVSLPMPTAELAAWKRSALQADDRHARIRVSEILPFDLATSLGSMGSTEPIELVNAVMWILAGLSQERLRATIAAAARLDNWLELGNVALRSAQVRTETWPEGLPLGSSTSDRSELARGLFSHALRKSLADGGDDPDAFALLSAFFDPLALGRELADGGAHARMVAGITGFVERPHAGSPDVWPALDRLDEEQIHNVADVRADVREGMGQDCDEEEAKARLGRVAPGVPDDPERPSLIGDIRQIVMCLDQRQCERVTLAVRALGDIDALQLANLAVQADAIPFVPYDRVPDQVSGREGALRALGETQIRMLRDEAREGRLDRHDRTLAAAAGCADYLAHAEALTSDWRCSRWDYVTSIPPGIETGIDADRVIEEGLVAEAKVECDRSSASEPLMEQRNAACQPMPRARVAHSPIDPTRSER